ncbi:hypothetical protein GGR57DRAFT_505380 [Xylariaceae sp. FL1272]|nr:hypothetical protein GGR57DRAFT_505380 [Xylariaceae sp. FL1272]
MPEHGRSWFHGRRFRGRTARMRSTPRKQFLDLVSEEVSRMWEADLRTRELPASLKRVFTRPGMGGPAFDMAAQKIKTQWLEQGIWKASWDDREEGPHPLDVWKHEQTFRNRDESHNEDDNNEWLTDPEALSQRSDAAKAEEELARDREASRPVHQFIYQVSQERRRLDARHGDYCWQQFPDINTQAYDIVKASWMARGIWDDKWGVLPGMIWKHEVVADWESGDSDGEYRHKIENDVQDGLQDEDSDEKWELADTSDEDAQLPLKREPYQLKDRSATPESKGERRLKRQRIGA